MMTLMSSIHVGYLALRASRARLLRASRTLGVGSGGGDDVTSCLLLFYSAECGLKERALRDSGKRSTADLDLTHDLHQLAKHLNMPRAVLNALGALNGSQRQQGNGLVELKRLHEAWRYGATLKPADQKAAREALEAVISWCESK